MKKLFTILVAFLFISSTQLFAQKSEKIEISDLPKQITDYINKHFVGVGIAKADLDKEHANDLNYDIELKDGTELEFDAKYNIREIESKKGIPSSTLSNAINNYLQENYPGIAVVEFELKGAGAQQIKLKNGKKLLFDKNNKFISVE